MPPSLPVGPSELHSALGIRFIKLPTNFPSHPRLKPTLLPLAFFLLYAFSGLSQTSADLQTGLTPFDSYHGGEFDQVSLSNGNLSIKIPLVSYPQRGGRLSLNYQLVYNGKNFQYTNVCTPAAPSAPAECDQVWGVNRTPVIGGLSGGWAMNTDQDVLTDPISLINKENKYNAVTSSIARWFTADGSVHYGVPLPNPSGQDAYQRAIDGSGLIVGLPLTSNQNGQNNTTCTTNCATRNAEGITYYPYAGVVREDSNGNTITAQTDTQGNTVTVDTLGRSIPGLVNTSDYTGCTGSLSITAALSWQPPGFNNSSLNYKFCFTTLNINIPVTDSHDGIQRTQSTLQSVVLPNGQAWTFAYNARGPSDPSSVNYGEVSQVTLPTGGTLTYTYNLLSSGAGNVSSFVTSRGEDANDGSGTRIWTYSWGNQSATPVSNTVTDPAGNDTVHSFISTFEPYETSSISYQGSASSGQALKTIATTYYTQWASDPSRGGIPGSPQGVFPQTVTTTLGQMVSQKSFVYGNTFTLSNGATANYGLVTDSQAYDFGNGSHGALLREEIDTYYFQNNPQYLTDNMLKLKAVHTVLDGSGNTVAQQSATYDESGYFTSYGPVTQHGSPLSGVRGNLTSLSAMLNGSNANPVTHSSWYDTGQVYQMIDPRGYTTILGYSSAYSGGLLTSSTNALHQTSSFGYDFSLGVQTYATDANGQTTNWNYDTLGRTILITRPNVFPGTNTPSQGTICYDDVAGQCTSSSPANAVVVTESVDPSTTIQQEQQVDGLGRKTLGRLLSDPDGITYTQTSYDNLGHVYQVANPTRCTPGSTSSCGETTAGVTTHLYDAIDREITTIPPDGTASSNNVTIMYSGNQTTTTDQAGIARRSSTDALGRLTQVTELNPNWVTLYQYDALGNLLCAEQHGGVSGTGCAADPSNDLTSPWRVRRFTYDSLSRLRTSNNPETGLITYTYDLAGNTTSKTDSRGYITNYSPSASPIDPLNRVTQKTYSDGEPSISYSYDSTGVSNGIGRRTGMTDGAGSTTWSYDPVGNISAQHRTTSGVSYTIATAFNLLGGPYQITYPSGAVVQYTDGGAGRTLAVTDIVNNINYASEMQYSPAGATASIVYSLGTFSSPYSPLGASRRSKNLSGPIASSGPIAISGITVNYGYDSRLQPSTIQAFQAINPPVSVLMSRVYDFGLGVNDNGNVHGITNVNDSTRNQSFSYDQVSRLVSAQAGTWGVGFTYDPWGNMTQTSGIPGSGLVNPMAVPSDLSANGQNQLSSTQVAYNFERGNMTSDGTQGYSYNTESQISNAGATNYTYDGDGQRVEKATSAGTASTGTLYWGGLAESDLAGNLTSEYIFVNGQRIAWNSSADGGVFYYIADHLGSSSMVVDAWGNIQNESDFYPFGGENPITQNMPDQKFKFTGKERDAESGLDYFGARYFGSSMGRFMSPDYADEEDDGPVSIPNYNPSNPQSLNLYSYVRNNPVTNTDPDGHDCVVQTRTSNTTESVTTSSGNCDNVSVGDGQTKTYVPGTVTGITANGGNSIDIGYNSYDGQSSGVTNASSAPIPDNTNLAYGWGNNAQGYQQLGAASRVVKGATVGVGIVFGAVGAGAAIGGAGGLELLGSLGSDLTAHAEEAQLLARHGITPDEARAAIEAAKKSGDVVEAMGRYGPQLRYTANGIRVVVATTGRNAGKIITAFFK